ncbi:MAG: energy transducer TonB [Thermoanaerobaculia bacterium]
MTTHHRRGAPFLAAFAFFLSAAAPAQSTAARIEFYKEAQYPEALHKTQQQGNVLLIARVDKQGKLQNIYPVATSHEGFVEPALDAVRLWKFHPATRDGRPIEIAANIGVRFRIQLQDKRGEIPRPMLGDLAIAPADAYGKATAPEGFPIRRGADAKLAAAALLDVSLNKTARSVPLKVEAWSPTGRRIPVFEEALLIPANATEIKVPVAIAIKPDWEDGVWMLRFFISDEDAGGGQFWLARDPSTFDFASKMPKPPAALPN